LDGWREAFRHIQRHPITGDLLGSKFSWHTAGRLVENYPHNTFLTIALKSGIPGVLLLAVPLGLLLWRAVRISARFKGELASSALLGITASVGALLVYSLYNLLFESPFMAWPTWAMMGLVIAISDEELSIRDHRAEGSKVVGVPGDAVRE
jgi:O-antigen ligase